MVQRDRLYGRGAEDLTLPLPLLADVGATPDGNLPCTPAFPSTFAGEAMPKLADCAGDGAAVDCWDGTAEEAPLGAFFPLSLDPGAVAEAANIRQMNTAT